MQYISMTMLALFTLAFMGTATASIVTDMSNKAALGENEGKKKKTRKKTVEVDEDHDGRMEKKEIDEEYED